MFYGIFASLIFFSSASTINQIIYLLFFLYETKSYLFIFKKHYVQFVILCGIFNFNYFKDDKKLQIHNNQDNFYYFINFYSNQVQFNKIS